MRQNLFTTSVTELFACFEILTGRAAKHQERRASTLLKVKEPFVESLTVEVEATAVK